VFNLTNDKQLSIRSEHLFLKEQTDGTYTVVIQGVTFTDANGEQLIGTVSFPNCKMDNLENSNSNTVDFIQQYPNGNKSEMWTIEIE